MRYRLRRQVVYNKFIGPGTANPMGVRVFIPGRNVTTPADI
jgi:hypothetical protein